MTPKCVTNTGFPFLSKHGRPLVHAFGDRWRSSDVSDFVCRLGLIPWKICYVSVLWKEYSVQSCFKTLQGVFVILGPGWNAAACRDVR